MRMMHTTLPDFFRKLKAAAVKNGKHVGCAILGLENLKTGKMQSVRTGRLEHEIAELSAMEGVESIEVAIVPRIPETMHNVVIRGFDKDGKPVHAICDTVAVIHPTIDILLHDCPSIDDRRPPLGRH